MSPKINSGYCAQYCRDCGSPIPNTAPTRNTRMRLLQYHHKARCDKCAADAAHRHMVETYGENYIEDDVLEDNNQPKEG